VSKSTKKTPVRAWDVNVHLTGVVNTKKYNTEYRYHCFVTCSHRRRLLVIGCLVLAITAVGASAVAAETREPLRTAGAQIEGTQTNATQIQHERPDAARRTGNASALERRLAGQLTDRLNQCPPDRCWQLRGCTARGSRPLRRAALVVHGRVPNRGDRRCRAGRATRTSLY